jgi:hypothetical protein
MHATNLRKVGGSVLLALPPAILEQIYFNAGATEGLGVATSQSPPGWVLGVPLLRPGSPAPSRVVCRE